MFESLRNDAELNGFFAFKNINTIRPVVNRIQSITTAELAVFEDDEKLKREIIGIGEFLSSLLTDVDSLENIAQTQVNRDTESTRSFNNEVRKLRRTVLRHGVQITAGLQVVNPGGNDGDNHYNAALSALAELREAHQASRNDTAAMRAVIDRRFFYSIKCLDSQYRVRLLMSLLEDWRKKYGKRGLLLVVINKVT